MVVCGFRFRIRATVSGRVFGFFRKKRINRKRKLGEARALIYEVSIHPLKISISP